MRTFGRVETSIWQNWRFHQFSDDEKLLWLYLIACPHGNALGCFVLPLGYVAADLCWGFERASEGLSKLQQRGRIERDEATTLTRVVGWFGHNRIENANVAKGILATLASLPRCEVLSNSINALLNEGGHFIEPLRKDFERAFKGLSKGFEPPEPEPEPEPEPIRKIQSATADSSKSLAAICDPAPAKAGLAREMADIWNRTCGDVLPRARGDPPKQRQQRMLARYAEIGRSMERWEHVCRRVRASDFLTGQTAVRNGREPFRASLDWLVAQNNFAKVTEGNYDNRKHSGRETIDDMAKRLAEQHGERHGEH